MPQEINIHSRAIALELGRPSPSSDVPRSGTLVVLWDSLQEFERKLLHFFQNGFEGSPPTLELSLDYSSQHVYRRISEQIGHDMELILRALGQRQIYHDLEEHKMIKQTLRIADWIAYEIALKPAIDAGFLPPTTAVTYFEKALNIRVIPYAPVALIGFPFRNIAAVAKIEAASASEPDQSSQMQTEDLLVFGDLLAIPHEVGHYVYWHSALHGNHRPVEVYGSVFAHQPQWVLQWMEELYADLYGYVIAGPVAALQLMNILQATDRKSLLFDDGEHPIPILRLYAAVDALTLLHFPKTAQALEKTWSDWVETQKIPDEFSPDGDTTQAIKLVDGRKIVKEVVQAIIALDFIKLRSSHAHRDRNVQTENWSSLNQERMFDASGEKEVLQKAYYDQFQVVINGFRKDTDAIFPVPELMTSLDNSTATASTKKPAPIILTLGETNTWLDSFLQMAGEQSDSTATPSVPEIPAQVWLAILEAGGWVEGPTGPGNFKTFIGEV